MKINNLATRNLFTLGFLAVLIMVACSKDEGDSRNPVSLLTETHYATNPNYTFVYDDENRLIECTTNGGTEIKEYYYDANGEFTGFKETTTSNAIYPIRRFTVEVNTPTEISGSFSLYDPNDVEDPTQESHIKYTLDNGLLKEYIQTYTTGNPWKKSFEHNSNGDLTAIQLFENPDHGHLYRMQFTEWDDKDNTNIFVSSLQTYPAMDIIPGIKISNHNMKDKTDLYQTTNCCQALSYAYEYNDFDQVTRIYILSQDQLNEQGDIVVPGGEEIDIATFDYVVVD